MQIDLKMILARIILAVLLFYSVDCDDDDERSVSVSVRPPPPAVCRPRCPRRQKCVEVSSGCQDANCQTSPTCVSRRAQTCKPSSCPPNKKCFNEVVPCFRPPCPVFLRCLHRMSPLCGNRRCRSDEQCVDLQNCGPHDVNCQRQDTCLPKTARTCESLVCEPGQKCVMLFPPCLPGQQCLPLPVCQDRDISNPLCGNRKCGPDEQCVDLQNCGPQDVNCQRQDTCLPKTARTCESVVCEPGQKCVFLFPPCLPGQQCLPLPVCQDTKTIPPPTCGLDEECQVIGGGRGICTEVVDEDCDTLSCPRRAVCIPSSALSCRNARCSAGFRCVNVQPPCPPPSPVCPLQPQCLPIDGQNCDGVPCGEGNQCVEVQACRTGDCKPFKKCIPNTIPTCAATLCAAPSRCILLQPICVREPCYPQATCVPTFPPPPPPPQCKLGETCTVLGGKEGYCGEVADQYCDSFTCPKTLKCIPLGGPGCHAVRCANCVNIEVPCPRQPCPIEPRCFPPSLDCGGIPCKPGQRCEDVYTCSRGSCTSRKICVDSSAPTCAAVTCLTGNRCVLLEAQCIRAPCNPIPSCIPINNECTPSTCPPGQTCYNAVEPGCERRDCPTTPVCAPETCLTCKNALCRNGFCLDTKDPDNTRGCPVTFNCVTASDCGGRQCRSDERCEDLQRCSRGTCTIEKACVDKRGPSCDVVDCEPANTCVLVEVQCVRAPCFPQPSCIPIEPNGGMKRGQCPRIRDDPLGRQCQRDSQCKGGDKCCQLAGVQTKTCTQAVSGGEKPGTCPRHDSNISTICVFNPEVNCIADGECPRDLKCCNRGCGRECLRPHFRRGKK